MKPTYREYIDRHFSGDTLGKCAEATLAMAAAFPELKRVRGHYFDTAWGERAHWWLTDADGGIIDPTASQFPTQGGGLYIPWKEGAEEPIALCPNCGGEVFPSKGCGGCCSERCATAYAAYVMGSSF
jgi:hypothetical protein